MGELVLMVLRTYERRYQYLGIIKKIDGGMRIDTKTYLVEWDDGEDNWYSDDTIDEMKLELRTYLESQNR